uniref:Uncharacterized protein n=1 Tax=Arundo donax TaxID=35708 RepID=A0A0A9CBS0_ARUDO
MRMCPPQERSPRLLLLGGTSKMV